MDWKDYDKCVNWLLPLGMKCNISSPIICQLLPIQNPLYYSGSHLLPIFPPEIFSLTRWEERTDEVETD